MPRQDLTINTPDGICPASVFTPASGPASGSGPWPAVLFLMDGFGIRPVMWDMCQRIADAGYLVLLPDLYYRMGSYGPFVPAQVLAEPKLREGFMKFVKSLDRQRKISDGGAFLDFLSSRTDVKSNRFGVTGYCLGGNVALTLAGAYPERFAAIASFHGGNLATDQPDSPHLFLKNVTGRVYVAGAMEDNSFPQQQKDLLDRTLTEAGVDHQVEIYPARHGFAVADLPAFDPAAADRHWTSLFKLFKETLRSPD